MGAMSVGEASLDRRRRGVRLVGLAAVAIFAIAAVALSTGEVEMARGGGLVAGDVGSSSGGAGRVGTELDQMTTNVPGVEGLSAASIQAEIKQAVATVSEEMHDKPLAGAGHVKVHGSDWAVEKHGDDPLHLDAAEGRSSSRSFEDDGAADRRAAQVEKTREEKEQERRAKLLAIEKKADAQVARDKARALELSKQRAAVEAVELAKERKIAEEKQAKEVEERKAREVREDAEEERRIAGRERKDAAKIRNSAGVDRDGDAGRERAVSRIEARSAGTMRESRREEEEEDVERETAAAEASEMERNAKKKQEKEEQEKEARMDEAAKVVLAQKQAAAKKAEEAKESAKKRLLLKREREAEAKHEEEVKAREEAKEKAEAAKKAAEEEARRKKRAAAEAAAKDKEETKVAEEQVNKMLVGLGDIKAPAAAGQGSSLSPLPSSSPGRKEGGAEEARLEHLASMEKASLSHDAKMGGRQSDPAGEKTGSLSDTERSFLRSMSRTADDTRVRITGSLGDFLNGKEAHALTTHNEVHLMDQQASSSSSRGRGGDSSSSSSSSSSGDEDGGGSMFSGGSPRGAAVDGEEHMLNVLEKAAGGGGGGDASSQSPPSSSAFSQGFQGGGSEESVDEGQSDLARRDGHLEASLGGMMKRAIAQRRTFDKLNSPSTWLNA